MEKISQYLQKGRLFVRVKYKNEILLSGGLFQGITSLSMY